MNKLFGAARGSRLVLLHDDDLLLPGAISALDRAFASSPSVVAAYGRQRVIRENGEFSSADTKHHHLYSRCSVEFTGLQDDPVVSALWLQFPNNGFLVDTVIAKNVGYLSDAEIGDACDADFGIRLALANRERKFSFIAQYTSDYRLTSSSIRTRHNNCWKSFDSVAALQGLTSRQIEARDDLLRRIAEQSVVDNAFHRRRSRGLSILRSPYYPKRKLPLKRLYHLAVIAVPGLIGLRDAPFPESFTSVDPAPIAPEHIAEARRPEQRA